MVPVRLALALPLLVVLPATAAEPIHMFSLSGKCQRLTLGDADLSGACTDSLLQITYDTGRVGLYAFTSGQQIYTFSGTSDEMVGSEIHQQLDQVILGRGDGEIGSREVSGTCIYENPFAGPALVTCTARDSDGMGYSLTFLTDGTAPVDQMAD